MKDSAEHVLSRLAHNCLTRKANLCGAAAFRVLSGLTVLYQTLLNYGQRRFLYGPDSIFASTALKGESVDLSFFGLSDGIWYFEVSYHAALGILAVWTTGLRTRLLTPAVWWIVFSLTERNGYIRDGGDNLIFILLAYCTLMDLSGASRCDYPSQGWHLTALHNFGVAACKVQVCTVYFVAGVSKLFGTYWPNGTALYYVYSSERFGSDMLSKIVSSSELLLVAGTWGPLLLQLSFPWVYLFGRAEARRFVVLIAMFFHAGIALTMGLVSFAAFMIASELLLLSDSDYMWIRRQYIAVRDGLSGRDPREGLKAAQLPSE